MMVHTRDLRHEPWRYRLRAFVSKPANLLLVFFLIVLVLLSLMPMATMLSNMFTVHVGTEKKLLRLPVGSTKTEGCKAFLRCVSKGIPGLSVDPGNTSENEATFAVSRYQLYVGGAEYWLIDQLNTILRVGGVDYAKDIRSLL